MEELQRTHLIELEDKYVSSMSENVVVMRMESFRAFPVTYYIYRENIWILIIVLMQEIAIAFDCLDRVKYL